jgi:RHS repeat-associated protein
VLVHEPARNRTFTFGWSRGGRLASLDVDGATTRWERDRDGRVLARHDPGGHTTRFQWDAAGRLAALSGAGWGRATVERDADGHMTALRAAGIERRWDHDRGGLVAGYHQTVAGTGHTTTLRRDGAGRVVEARDPRGVTRYRYDEAGQLVAAAGPDGAWTWHYDPAGRLAREDGPEGTTTYTYDEAHQLVRADGPAGVTTYAYDAAGRRVREDGPAGARSYHWDARGDLTAVEAGGRRLDVDVDALGQLAAYGDTTFGWDPTGTVPSLVAIGERRVVGPPGHPLGVARPDGAVTPLGADWRGDVERGVATDPWGRPVRADPAPGDGGDHARGAGDAGDAPDVPGLGAFGELDLGGLTWLRHRLYDPETRSFLAPDPLPGIPGLPVAANPYHYANNDPLGFVDPLGLQPLSIDQYNDIRQRETGVQWGNIALAALTVGSFFIPGGPIVMTLVGAGMGMAPSIIQGVTTGEWDAGAMLKGALVGGISARLGFAAGGTSVRGLGMLSQTGARGAITRGAATGFGSGVVTEAYDVLPIPGADGSFDVENVAVSTVIGGGSGGLAHHLSPPRPSLVSIADDIRSSGLHPAARNQRTIAVGEDASGGLHAGSSNGFDAGQRAALQRNGVHRVPGSGRLHAEEELLRDVPDLQRVGTSVRDPCGPDEHNCRQQLLDRGVEIENDGI